VALTKSKKKSVNRDVSSADDPMSDLGDSSVSQENNFADRHLADALLAEGLVSREALDRAHITLVPKGMRLGDVLVAEGLLSEVTLVEVLAKQFGLGVVDLNHEYPDPKDVGKLPEAMARELTAVIFRVEGGTTFVAVPNQLASSDGARVRSAVSGNVEFALAPSSRIRRTIDASYRATSQVHELAQAFESIQLSRRGVATDVDAEIANDEAPVVQVITKILTQAVRDRASDVHIEPTQDKIRIRYRIDGALATVLELPYAMGPSLVSRVKVMAQMNIVERRRPQDGQFAIEVDGNDVDVRVATISTIWGEHCSMRVLEKSRAVMSLAELGMPRDTYESFRRFVRAPSGMVLCTGPTGSGKTTTLYAILSEVVEDSRNVMTIEDPVEYVLPSTNQIQTNDQAGLSFATGLRSILRQDPDVILVGEIRDVETARVAVQAALTGHAVLSSVHATDAVSALHRFLDMGIEAFLISSSVIAIVGQRLVRRICPSCKAEYTPSDEELAFFREYGSPRKTTFYRGEGCNFCSGTGYHDRIGVFELLPITSEIKRLVAGWASQDELRAMAEKQGMRTIRQEAFELLNHDVTTIAEVIRSAYSSTGVPYGQVPLHGD
jgi:type IV pilus assembly protein PilB